MDEGANVDSFRMYDVVIVGCGHSGAQLAVALRQNGFHGSVAMVDGQDGLPYERPPLSKDSLTGTKGPEDILIRPDTYWTDQDVDLHLGAARRWRGPGADLRGIHRVRDRGDVDRIATASRIH
jgi:3-phenylpropionate/trans-cinnamate dioxygenase ferredoxin reductase subunit